MKPTFPRILSILLVLILVLCSGLRAQTNSNTLSGRIADKLSGQPLAGAVIHISDLNRTAVADTGGMYYFSNISSGNFVVEIRMIGYSNYSQTVNIKGETRTDFFLEETHMEVHEVIITGTSRATEIIKSPVPTVAVDNQYLRQNQGSNLLESLSKVPGFSTVSTGPNVSKPFIRGLGYNRILTLYDGTRQEGQQWGDEHGEEIDEYMIERVEIVKGPASLSYGSDALGGVVNLIPQRPAPEGRILGNLLTNYQTNNNLLAGSLNLNGTLRSFNFQGRITHKQAMDYQNKIDGRVFGTAFLENDASLSGSINHSWGNSRLGLSIFDDLQEIPEGGRDSASRKFTKPVNEEDSSVIVPADELNTYKIQPVHQHIQHYRVYTNNSFRIGEGRLKLDVGYQFNHRQEFSHPEFTLTPGLDLSLNTITYNTNYSFGIKNGWEPAIGVNVMYQANKITGTEVLVPGYHLFDGGIFGVVRKTLHKFDLSAGARYDLRIFSGEDVFTRLNPATGFQQVVSTNDTAGAHKPFSAYRRNFSGISGSIGITYAVSRGFSVKANIARGYRAPNIYEISSNGIHPGTNIFQKSNPDFKPEYTLEEDLGILLARKHISVEASIFNNNIQNYIYNRGLGYRDPSGNDVFQFVSGNALLYGGEASVDIHPHPLDWLHFENAVTITFGVNRGERNDSGKFLPFIPPVHTSHELRADLKKSWRRLSDIYAKVGLEYFATQGRAYLAYGTETPTPGYALLNAGLGANFTDKKGRTLFSFDLIGTNLANIPYQSHLSRLKYFEAYPDDPRPYHGIYNMGRNISIRLTVPFRLK